MKTIDETIIFGPVPSRRLGYSLGVNNIPPKICTYACVYCQIGRTLKMQGELTKFYAPEAIFELTKSKVEKIRSKGEKIDYITFVPDGEPTLDINLGKEIELIKQLGIPVAVITNSSLIMLEDVREALLKADWVSVKVDTTDEKIWQKIDRPYGKINLRNILNGLEEFASAFNGKLITETMLVKDINDSAKDIEDTAKFIAKLNTDISYISIPTRPPAENWVLPPDENALISAFNIYEKYLNKVEYLIGYEGDEFSQTGDIEKDILSITSVHPMRDTAIQKLLSDAGSDFSVIDNLIKKGEIIEITYGEHKFYLRKLKN